VSPQHLRVVRIDSACHADEEIRVADKVLILLEMFACFGLKRMDVFSTGDLGVQ
jgi:hypothetical protein